MDIDIDVPSDIDGFTVFTDWVRASNVLNENLVPHPVGVYCQKIPIDPITNLSAIPYKVAEDLEYFKIDFLHLKIYDYFTSREEIETLLAHDPDWDLLKSPGIVRQLFQLGNHFNTVQKINPRSISDLADCIALIRPGKIHLLDKYLENKEYWRKVLYTQRDDDQYNYKKSHAIAYAHVIVIQLHLISAGINFE